MNVLLANLDEALPAALEVIQAGAYGVGILFAMSAFSGWAKKSSDPRGSADSPVADFLAGCGLMAVGYLSGLGVETFTGDTWSATPHLSYWGGTTDVQQQNLQVILRLIQVLGYLGICWAMVLWRDAGHSRQHAETMRHPAVSGAFFFVFGAASINIKATMAGVAWLTGMPLPAFLR